LKNEIKIDGWSILIGGGFGGIFKDFNALVVGKFGI
jgi:hypothetical protein